MLALDRRAGRAAVELASLFDLGGDAARFARPGNTAVFVVDTNLSGNSSTRFAAADEEATNPTEGGGPLALPVEGFCRSRGVDAERFADTMRRVASIAAQRCCRGVDGRRAVAALATAPGTPLCVVKCLAVFLSRGLAPRHWAPEVPKAVARLRDATADALRGFVARHEPCVLDSWALAGGYEGVLETLGDDAYLIARCGDREVPTRCSYIDTEGGCRVFASAANGTAAIRAGKG